MPDPKSGALPAWRPPKAETPARVRETRDARSCYLLMSTIAAVRCPPPPHVAEGSVLRVRTRRACGGRARRALLRARYREHPGGILQGRGRPRDGRRPRGRAPDPRGAHDRLSRARHRRRGVGRPRRPRTAIAGTSIRSTARRTSRTAIRISRSRSRSHATRTLLLGLVYDPVREEIFSALPRRGRAPERGPDRGLRGRRRWRTRCSAPGSPTTAGSAPDFYLAFWPRRCCAPRASGVPGSAALDLCYVAGGPARRVLGMEAPPWDTAAGRLDRRGGWRPRERLLGRGPPARPARRPPRPTAPPRRAPRVDRHRAHTARRAHRPGHRLDGDQTHVIAGAISAPPW